MAAYREEKDTMGVVRVPETAYYGAQTQRAVDNFPIGDLRMPLDFIRALALIKRCGAEVNRRLGLLEPRLADAVASAAREVLEGRFDDQFARAARARRTRRRAPSAEDRLPQPRDRVAFCRRLDLRQAPLGLDPLRPRRQGRVCRRVWDRVHDVTAQAPPTVCACVGLLGDRRKDCESRRMCYATNEPVQRDRAKNSPYNVHARRTNRV